MKVKSFRIVILILILSILSLYVPFVDAITFSNTGDINNYIVVELEHDQILYKHNSERETNSSLLNRLMTCLITLEYHSITSLVTPSQNSVSRNERYQLLAGEQYTIESLIKATMLGGADNTATALANHITTNQQDFVNQMNDKASQFGMNNTFFANADGAPNEFQHTTLYDISLFMKNAMKNQQFKNIFNQEMALIWDTRIISNLNKLVTEDQSSFETGGVLGHFNNTTTAPNTSIFYVETDRPNSLSTMRLLFIVAGSLDDNYIQTTELLLQNVLSNYKRDLLVKEGAIVFDLTVDDEKLNLISSSNVYCTMAKDIGNIVQNKSYTFIEGFGPDVVQAPIAAGTVFGTANYHLKDGAVIQFPIVAERDISERKTTVKTFIDRIKDFHEIYFLIIALLVLESIILLFKFIGLIQSTKIKGQKKEAE